jgi:ribose 5-phosphate isomerase A
LGYSLELRKNADATPFITDNHNFIYDIHFASLRKNPEEDDLRIRSVPGVIETGFFFNLAGPVIIGKQDGTLSVLE